MTHLAFAPASSRRWILLLGAWLLASLGCSNTAKLSAQRAGDHVDHLAQIVTGDVQEVRTGLPAGAEQLAKAFSGDADPLRDPELARQALESARGRVQDLRVAKSTFFALVEPTGNIVRNDRDPDLMAGKGLFDAFPTLKGALEGKYVEAIGSLHEARGVEGKPDGQWMAAHPVKGPSATLGLYVTGWAWSTYARRLEHALRTRILDTEPGIAEPLCYVFVVASGRAYGSPASPEVNAKAIEDAKLSPGDDATTRELEITGRAFGLAAKRVSALGEGVFIVVLRSET